MAPERHLTSPAISLLTVSVGFIVLLFASMALMQAVVKHVPQQSVQAHVEQDHLIVSNSCRWSQLSASPKSISRQLSRSEDTGDWLI